MWGGTRCCGRAGWQMHSLPRLTATIQRRMCGRWCRWRRRRRRRKSTAATPRPRLYALDTHFILYLRLRLGTNEAILRFALGRRLTPVPTMPSLPPRDGVDAPPCAGIRAGASTVSTDATLNSVVGPSLPLPTTGEHDATGSSPGSLGIVSPSLLHGPQEHGGVRWHPHLP